VTGDYPLTLPPVNHTAPVPRRIRAILAGQTVLDTMSALYVWEWLHYPQYYISLADTDPAVLVDEQHEQKLSRGTARRYSLQVGDVTQSALACLVAGHGCLRRGRDEHGQAGGQDDGSCKCRDDSGAHNDSFIVAAGCRTRGIARTVSGACGCDSTEDDLGTA
jgi:Domain of unknown function (DUF427)